jgi:hypothetical protein
VGHDLHEVEVAGLAFPRKYVMLLPAYGEASESVTNLMDELRHEAAIWCRPQPQDLEAA